MRIFQLPQINLSWTRILLDLEIFVARTTKLKDQLGPINVYLEKKSDSFRIAMGSNCQCSPSSFFPKFPHTLSCHDLIALFYIADKILIAKTESCLYEFLSLPDAWLISQDIFCTGEGVGWCLINICGATIVFHLFLITFRFILIEFPTDDAPIISTLLSNPPIKDIDIYRQIFQNHMTPK